MTMIHRVETGDAPELRLLAAVIRRALKDVVKGRPSHAAGAMAYFEGENFESDCLWLGLDFERLRESIRQRATERLPEQGDAQCGSSSD